MTENNFHADLVAALSEITNPPMTQTNPHFRSKFSSLIDCVNTIRPILAKHHIAATQMVRHGDAGDRVVTRLVHASGEFVEDGGIPLANTSDPQKMGSAMTYARRYGLLAICGAVGDPDDDGNKASEPEPVLAAPPPPAPSVPAETKSTSEIKQMVEVLEQRKLDGLGIYTLNYLDARTLPFDDSTAWVDAYATEMRSTINDKKLTPDEKMSLMHEFEQKNAPGLEMIPDGARAVLESKRLSANKKLGASK
jgi:hypothetical protein